MLGYAIAGAIETVTKDWCKQRKAEDRHVDATLRRWDALTKASKMNIKDAAYSVMAKAYRKASDNGAYPANARQVMYAARAEILRLTGKTTLDDAYFTQTLLPDFIRDHSDETAGWDIAYDARGHFLEPHTDREVALGTLEVREYVEQLDPTSRAAGIVRVDVTTGETTIGPTDRFGAVLFIEKEGFMSLFAKVKLAERFDLAIMSSKGQSVVAARRLVDEVCGPFGIPLLILRDFDVSGFSIANSLQNDGRRYEFVHEPRVVDLGLRLADAERYGLESEPASVSESARRTLGLHGATEGEIEFLLSGQRVELNAFTSGDFVRFIEEKLREHGVKKVVPRAATLGNAFRLATEARIVEEQMDAVLADAKAQAESIGVPKGLRAKVNKALERDPALSWDEAVARLAHDEA